MAADNDIYDFERKQLKHLIIHKSSLNDSQVLYK